MDGIPGDCETRTVLVLRPDRGFDPAGPAYVRTGAEVPVPFAAPTGEWEQGDLRSTVEGQKRCWFRNGAYMANGAPHDLDLFNLPLSERPDSLLPATAPRPVLLPAPDGAGDPLRHADAVADALDDAFLGEDSAVVVQVLATLFGRAVHRSPVLEGDVSASLDSFLPVVRNEVAIRRAAETA